MSYRTVEPSDLDHAPDVEREQELAREQRWTQFVKDVRGWGDMFGWQAVLSTLCGVYVGRDVGPLNDLLAAFAASEGWPDTVTAIGRAMRESAADAAETERRR